MDKLTVQKAIDWIDGNLSEASLAEISKYIGYSEFHTSRQFKKYTDSTLRKYIMLRRLSKAAKELKSKNIRIIDCAINNGFSSQQAFTKSFHNAFGINPGEYQQSVRPIPLLLKKDILYPHHIKETGAIFMVKDEEIKMKVVEVPEHKFHYFEAEGVDNYIDFWEKLDKEGKDCDYIHGMFASVEHIYKEGYGGFTDTGYIFGKDTPLDVELNIDGIKSTIIPKQTCLVFEHPGFTEAEFHDALTQVRRVALEKFDFSVNNYDVDKSFVNAYEHSGMELCVYFIRIVLKKG